MAKLYLKVAKDKGFSFHSSRKDDENYIRSLPIPRDDIQRSYQQFLCQKRSEPSLFRYSIFNIASFFLLIPYYFLFSFARFKSRREKDYDAVITLMDFPNKILPVEISTSITCSDFNRGSLNKQDKKFLAVIRKRYPFAFYFRFKCLCRIAAYSDFIKRYNPKMVICSAEFSFTSSILTMYCEQHGIVHTNIMHGEKLYMLREAFSRFSRFYVWDEFYIDLFHSLRADKTEYILAPMELPEIAVDYSDDTCVYYLGSETEIELLRIKDALEQLGKQYWVRPHPSYSTPAIRKIFSDKQIQDCKKVDVWDSIAHAGMVISVCSTVLYQAYLKGVSVMIDDISQPELYKDLFERDYIMLNKPHVLLSEEIRKRKIDESDNCSSISIQP